MNDFQIKPVKSYNCPTCGELMIKFYPWSPYQLPDNVPVENCNKCQGKGLPKYKKAR